MTAPKPRLRRALLWSKNVRRPTWHRYVSTMECVIPRGADPEGGTTGGPGWEFLYECEETGAQRRWGVEDRKATRYDEPLKVEEGN